MTTATRTQDEIAVRIRERMQSDIFGFGFEWHEYLLYLNLDRVQEFLKPDANTEGLPPPEPCTREGLITKMKKYMSFAFDKAHNQRGLSAERSISHYVAWTWLAGDDELSVKLDEGYEDYGLSQLHGICEHYGWDLKTLEDNSSDE